MKEEEDRGEMSGEGQVGREDGKMRGQREEQTDRRGERGEWETMKEWRGEWGEEGCPRIPG